MSGLNRVMLIGNLGQDPELRHLPNGGAAVSITVATSESWKDKNTGQQQERTEWHRVVAYRRLAEIIGEYLHKGSKVYIEGKLQTRKWQGQDGQDRYTTEIIADQMQMLDGVQQNQTRPSGTGGDQFQKDNGFAQNQPAQQQAPSQQANFDDSEIPF